MLSMLLGGSGTETAVQRGHDQADQMRVRDTFNKRERDLLYDVAYIIKIVAEIKAGKLSGLLL